MTLKLVVNNTKEEVEAELAKKEQLLVERVVDAVRKCFLDNPDKSITQLAVSLFASTLVSQGSDFPKDPKKRREILNRALQILLNNDC